MTIFVETKEHKPLEEPYILKLYGWDEARYFSEAPENRICEFKDGVVIMHSPASARHQEIVGFLTFLLRGYCDFKKMGRVYNGPAVLRLREGLNREPDIFVLRYESRVLGTPIEEKPIFIVEVSQTTQDIDLVEKVEDYSLAGVGEYWVVDIENNVLYVHRLVEGGRYEREEYREGRVESKVLEGFWIQTQWLWQKDLPSEIDCLNEILKTKLI